MVPYLECRKVLELAYLLLTCSALRTHITGLPQGRSVRKAQKSPAPQPRVFRAGRLPTATCFPSRCNAGALVNVYGVTSRMRDCRFTHTQNTPTCADCAALAPIHISRHQSAWTEGVYFFTHLLTCSLKQSERWLAASYSRHTELLSRACILAAPRKWYRAAKLFLSISRKHGCEKSATIRGVK